MMTEWENWRCRRAWASKHIDEPVDLIAVLPELSMAPWRVLPSQPPRTTSKLLGLPKLAVQTNDLTKKQ
jgi:hypothetical protein